MRRPFFVVKMRYLHPDPHPFPDAGEIEAEMVEVEFDP